MSARFVSLNLWFYRIPFSGIHACLIQQARYGSMMLFGQIRQGTLPFYYINHPNYIIGQFMWNVNQSQHSLYSLCILCVSAVKCIALPLQR